MKQILSLDIGNTRLKVNLWEPDAVSPSIYSRQDKSIQSLFESDMPTESDTQSVLQKIKSIAPEEITCVLSQVGAIERYTPSQSSQDEAEIIEWIKKKNIKTISIDQFFKNNYFFEMPVHYEKTLGIDRIIAAHSVFEKCHSSRQKDSLSFVIDFGSYITVDAVSKRGFLGGHILPGKKAWAHSYEQGHQLAPLVPKINKELQKFTEYQDYDWPQNSVAAMSKAYGLAMTSFVLDLTQQHSPKRVFITGGDGESFYQALKKRFKIGQESSSIELIHSPLLVQRHLRDLANVCQY